MIVHPIPLDSKDVGYEGERGGGGESREKRKKWGEKRGAQGSVSTTEADL